MTSHIVRVLTVSIEKSLWKKFIIQFLLDLSHSEGPKCLEETFTKINERGWGLNKMYVRFKNEQDCFAGFADEVVSVEPAEEHRNVHDAFLNVLGLPATTVRSLGPVLQQQIIEGLDPILKAGLEGEAKTHLLSKYPAPENGLTFLAPKLNEEVAFREKKPVLQRDGRLAALQTQAGAALTALGLSLNHLLAQEPQPGNLQLVEHIGDAGKLIADIFNDFSKSRRALLSNARPENIKDIMLASPAGEWLFGADLGERLKTSKNLERASQDLAGPSPKTLTRSMNNQRRESTSKPATVQKGHLNSRRPPRAQGTPMGGRVKRATQGRSYPRSRPYSGRH